MFSVRIVVTDMKAWARDVLPEPLAPIIAVKLPLDMLADTPSRIAFCLDFLVAITSSFFLNKDAALSNIVRAGSMCTWRLVTVIAVGVTFRNDSLEVSIGRCCSTAIVQYKATRVSALHVIAPIFLSFHGASVE